MRAGVTGHRISEIQHLTKDTTWPRRQQPLCVSQYVLVRCELQTSLEHQVCTSEHDGRIGRQTRQIGTMRCHWCTRERERDIERQRKRERERERGRGEREREREGGGKERERERETLQTAHSFIMARFISSKLFPPSSYSAHDERISRIFYITQR